MPFWPCCKLQKRKRRRHQPSRKTSLKRLEIPRRIERAVATNFIEEPSGRIRSRDDIVGYFRSIRHFYRDLSVRLTKERRLECWIGFKGILAETRKCCWTEFSLKNDTFLLGINMTKLLELLRHSQFSELRTSKVPRSVEFGKTGVQAWQKLVSY